MFLNSQIHACTQLTILTSLDHLDGEVFKNHKIIHYDDRLPYADRLISAFESIEDEWILFTHEIDIPVRFDYEFLLNALSLLQELKGVRLNLQVSSGGTSVFHTENGRTKNLFINEALTGTTYLREVALDNSELAKSQQIYRYNVNPAIINVPVFKRFLEDHTGFTYRDIEHIGSERWHLRERIFNLYNIKSVQCGYFSCAPEYMFCHMTHFGMLSGIFLSGNQFVNEQGQSMDAIVNDYLALLNRFKTRIPTQFWGRLTHLTKTS